MTKSVREANSLKNVHSYHPYPQTGWFQKKIDEKGTPLPITHHPILLCQVGSCFTLSFLDGDQSTGKFNETSLEIPKFYLTHGDDLMLSSDRKDNWLLCLINPLTKKIVTLPRLPVNFSEISLLFAVGCSPSTLECKVMYTHIDSEVGTHRMNILTVGVDKEWRAIHEEPSTTLKPHCAQRIWEFIYWYNWVASYLIAFDVETEVFYMVFFPEECRGRRVSYTNSDRFLSIALKPHDAWHRPLIEVEFWVLVDCKSGGEWRKLGRIDWESKRRELNEMGLQSNCPSEKFMSISPVTVLNNREIAIFHFKAPNFTYVAYNFKTGRCFR